MTEINFLIMKDQDGGTAHLTNKSANSRYGIPVFRITAEDTAGDLRPSDLIGDLSRPGKHIYAANIVHSWGSQSERTDPEKEAAVMYLRQWPEGPQL